MALILRPPWTRQPQGAAPLSPLAARADLFFERGGLNSRIGSAKTTLGGSPALGGAPYGIGRHFTTYTHEQTASGWPVLADGTEYTYLVVFARSASLGAIAFIVNGDHSDRCFQLRLTSGGAPEFIAFNTAVSTFSVTGVAVPVGESHCVVAVVASGGVRLYQNGRLTGTSSAITGTIKGQPASDFILGNRLGLYLGGSMGQVARWPFALSDAQAKAISAEPWRLFAPRTIIIPLAAAAGGAPTITALSARLITTTSAQPRISYS